MCSVDEQFNILVVDHNRTCLVLEKACLKKWKYRVTTAKSISEALRMLKSSGPFDLVMTEVHMPDTHGFEFLRKIIEEFDLPVILMSADTTTAPEGMTKGAQSFLLKPIGAEDVKNTFQYALWWKIKKNNRIAPITQHHTGQDINAGEGASSATRITPGLETSVRRNQNITWTPDLHYRFVEAILQIGYEEAVPAKILERMNVPGLKLKQVGSHLQKYRKFLDGVLDGRTTRIELSPWIDLNYRSSVVPGNPDEFLINYVKERQINGMLAAHNPLPPINTVSAPNGSSSSGQYRPLPPSIRAGASSISSTATLPATCTIHFGNTTSAMNTQVQQQPGGIGKEVIDIETWFFNNGFDGQGPNQ